MSTPSRRSMRAHGQLSSEMPLRQYVLFVGGALIALLYAANWLLLPAASNELINAGVEHPVIRIHSERKGPEAVVIDTTSLPMLAGHEDVVAPATVTAQELPLDQASAHPVSPLAQLAGASGPNRTEEGQKQTRGTVVRTGLERRPISHRHPDAARVQHARATLARSGPEFGETFAQFVPWSPPQAGRGEPKTRRGMGSFSHGGPRDPFQPCCAIFTERRAEAPR